MSREDNRENRGGISNGEWNGVGCDGEFGSIENDERGAGDDVEVDGDRSSETVLDEVGLEPNVVQFGNGEFWKTRLSFELIHSLFLLLSGVTQKFTLLWMMLMLGVKIEVRWDIYRDCSVEVKMKKKEIEAKLAIVMPVQTIINLHFIELKYVLTDWISGKMHFQWLKLFCNRYFSNFRIYFFLNSHLIDPSLIAVVEQFALKLELIINFIYY